MRVLVAGATGAICRPLERELGSETRLASRGQGLAADLTMPADA